MQIATKKMVLLISRLLYPNMLMTGDVGNFLLPAVLRNEYIIIKYCFKQRFGQSIDFAKII